MGIIGNYTVLSKLPLQYRGGNLAGDRSNYSEGGMHRNQYTGAFLNYNSTPNGYNGRGAWIMSPKGGGMAIYTTNIGTLSTTNSLLAAGINIDASLTASIIISNAILDQIVDLITSITGNISTTNAQLAAVAALQASITGTMSITQAQIGALVDLLWNASATGTLIGGNFATLELAADIGGATPLSPEGLAEAVWNYLKANPTTTGSMKEVLEKAKQSADAAFAVSS